MLSRSHVLRAGYVLLISAGVICFNAIPMDNRRQTTTTHHAPRTEPLTAAAVGHGPAVPNDDDLHQARQLLDEQSRLDPTERGREDEIRCALLKLLTDENAAGLVQTLPAESLSAEFGVAALARWASVDTLGAVLWLARQPAQSAEQTHAIARALSRDPELLETLCAQLPPGAWRETLLENSCRATLPENPSGAIWLAQRLSPGPDRTKALLMIADDWTARDPAAAARWIASEPDLFLQDELILAGSTALASTDPASALAWSTNIASPASFERTIDRITALWTSYAPTQAGQFSALLSAPGQSRSEPH